MKSWLFLFGISAAMLMAQESCPTTTDGDGDGFTTADGDCDDDNASVYPGALEVCDGVDNDCDAEIDEVGGGWGTARWGNAQWQ